MAYNGYTNHETWLVSIWMEETLRMLIQENEMITNRHMYDLVYEYIEMEDGNPASLRKDLVSSALNAVNWRELYDLYTEDNPA
tara:strand:+ start:20864 stop:21112 length:249 start_codon:yes stop_codon:yes gene_type:complete